ncbi:MAG: hypothetical protein P4L49_11335 [Desulfosporosinus sp.]|nr:hypothetical protein [Desulfosporosinus sp.]
MNTIANYSSILNMYNQTVSQTASTPTQYTSSTAPITSAATTTQSTDSVSISQEAQQAYQALNQSLVDSLSPDDPNANTLESVLMSSMQASIQPFMQIIADKANAVTNGSVAGVAGAASPTGAISTDWGSALDSLVSSGTITQGQETSIENALDAEAQLKVSVANTTSGPTASTSNLNSLLSN